MCTIVSKLNILFEKPFWVGIYEREYNGQYKVCKITFGSEPKDYEVYDFMLKNWNKLKFSPDIKTVSIAKKCVNPKRMQRLINKQIVDSGIGTKAQQALKFQQEQVKLKRKSYFCKKRDAEKQRKFELREKKRKEKHRGH